MRTPVRTTIAATALLLAAAGPALAVQPTTAEPVDLGGASLPGGDASTDPGNPTELEAGLWADALAVSGPSHQFSYTRTMRDSTVHLAAVGSPLDPEGDELALEAFDEEGESCGSDSGRTSYPVNQAVIGPAVDVGPSEPGERDGTCLTAETIRFAVGRSETASPTTELPIAIKIVEEAPADAGGLPTPAPSALATPPEGGPEESIEPGASLDDAPEVESGRSYALELAEGGQSFVKVRLEWGQSLDVRVDVPAQDPALEEEVGFFSGTVDLGLVDPMRNPFGGLLDDSDTSASWSDEAESAVDGVPPLLYLDRFDDPAASLPGDYWVRLAAAPPSADREPLDIPVTLTVQVRGEAGDGAPAYPETVQGPGGSAGPDGYAPETPFLVGEDSFSADPSGNPPPRAEDGDTSGAAAVRRIGGGLLAAVSLGLCVAGALRLRRRPV